MEITGSVDVASVVRDQFMAFDAVGSDIRLNPDQQRRVLLITEDDWPGWSGFKEGGPLPAQPVPPIMLQRLASVTYRLACLVDRRITARP